MKKKEVVDIVFWFLWGALATLACWMIIIGVTSPERYGVAVDGVTARYLTEKEIGRLVRSGVKVAPLEMVCTDCHITPLCSSSRTCK